MKSKNSIFTSSAKSGSPQGGMKNEPSTGGHAKQKGMKPMNTAKATPNGRAAK